MRCRGFLAGGYGSASSGAAVGAGEHVDDHQLARSGHLGNVSGCCRKERRRLEETFRDDSERYSQGIYCAKGIHISSCAFHAVSGGYDFVRRRETPRWNPISVSGYHIREAGSTAVQEL